MVGSGEVQLSVGQAESREERKMKFRAVLEHLHSGGEVVDRSELRWSTVGPGRPWARAACSCVASAVASSACSAKTGRTHPVEWRGISSGIGRWLGGDDAQATGTSRAIWRRSLRNSPWAITRR
jgi:hypothetical protein